MNTKKISLIILLATLFSCGQGQEELKGFRVKGNFTNLPSQKVYLEMINGQNFVQKGMADATAEGEFTIEGETNETDICRIKFNDNSYIFLVLENREITIKGDAKDPFNTLEIEGSDESKLLQEYITQTNFNQEMQQMSMQYQQRMMSGDATAQTEYEQIYMQKLNENNEATKAMIKKNPQSLVSGYAALGLSVEENFEFLNEISSSLGKSKYSTELITKLEGLKTVAMGQVAPDIALPAPNGNVVKLSDYKGKYVLIDFWASWCKPCRMENPNVVKMYDKYKTEDFEIFGVSLDKSMEAWVKAIENDGITWPQVSDLKFWSSDAARLYQVSSIPQTFLLDKEGKIIAKNLRGEALENKLKEIFGK